jgi:hypothetical protein
VLFSALTEFPANHGMHHGAAKAQEEAVCT